MVMEFKGKRFGQKFRVSLEPYDIGEASGSGVRCVASSVDNGSQRELFKLNSEEIKSMELASYNGTSSVDFVVLRGFYYIGRIILLVILMSKGEKDEVKKVEMEILEREEKIFYCDDGYWTNERRSSRE